MTKMVEHDSDKTSDDQKSQSSDDSIIIVKKSNIDCDTDPILSHTAGFMGFDGKVESDIEKKRTIQQDIIHWCILYFRFAIMTMFIWQTMILVLIGKPLHLFSPKLWRMYSSTIQYMITPGFLCVPFSWVGCPIFMKRSSWKTITEAKKTNSVILANHGARIDWVVGLFICEAGNLRARVAFVVEWVIKWIPVLGWYRWLMEDIFVNRSYKQDGPNIKRNIESFHKTKTKRFFIMCPEGKICDNTVEDDRIYIDDCQNFCKENGYPVFNYLLTPRYKGLGGMLHHSNKNKGLISAINAYVNVETGMLLNNKLRSTSRIVPDWYTILGGKIKVVIHIHRMPVFTDRDFDVKNSLMKDYARKDRELAYFHKNGKYQDADVENDPYEPIPVNHIRMNISLLMNCILWVMYYMYTAPNEYQYFLHHNINYALLYALYRTLRILFIFFIVISASHNIGFYIITNDSISRESVPFETPIKGLLIRVRSLFLKKIDDKTK